MKKMMGGCVTRSEQGIHTEEPDSGLVLAGLTASGKQRLERDSSSRGRAAPTCLCVDLSPRERGQ